MDVKYIPSDWEKMKSGVGDLIGLGRWGKGMIDELKDITANLEDAESDIAKYDSDGVISFHHIDQDGKYQSLFEDFKVLHKFTGKVGDIVDRTIDQPFYEDIDGFMAAIRDASISNYTTENRIGATEIQVIHYGHGIHETQEIDKTEVNLDDLLSGGNFYSDQMKLEYEAWKEVNPDQEFSQEDYQLAAVNMRAFGYESIKDQQQNKEFWVNVAALVVIVGVSLVCPPAGLSLGIAYGTFELSSAVSGKDWISGRELGTAERWTRGLLAPLDIVPGVAGIKKFSGTVRTANQFANMGQFGTKTGLKTAIQHEMNHVGNMVITAGKQSSTRLKSAGNAIKDGARVAKNKAIDDIIEVAELGDKALTGAKNIMPTRKVVALEQGMNVKIPAENTHFFANKTREILGKTDGVNVGGGKISKADKAKLEKWDWPPNEELYLTNKEVYDNPRFFDQETGRPKYPGEHGDPNIGGFINGQYDTEKLAKGKVIDRYGDNGGGQYFSPDGSSYESRALPPFMKDKPYERYEILKEFEVRSGEVAPWFGEGGKGIQHYTAEYITDIDTGEKIRATVENLLANDYIVKIVN